jgi:type IV pilus assembly protein PilC
MEYQYKAMKANGEMVEGVFTADNRRDVIEMLKNNNNFPVDIREKEQVGTKEVAFSTGVGAKELSFFCRQLHAMLKAGSTISKSLDIMKRQIKKRKFREVVNDIHRDVQKGTVLSLSMKNHPKVFPELMIYMVESGEMSGNLDTIFLRLADYFEKENKLKGKVKSAMVYPIILMVMSVLVVAFLVTFILPTFVSMFEKSDVPLPLMTQMLLNFSSFVRKHTVIIVIGILIIIILIHQYIHSKIGRRQIDVLKLKIPIVKDVNTKIITARFTRNLSTMLSSGVPMLTALKNLADVISNQVFAEAILSFREEIQKGNDLHEVVRESHLFPPMVDGMMEIGKESGTLDEILDKTADFFDEEVETALARLVTMFEPLMILFMAFIVGFIVIAMALPMFDMFQTISG